MKRRISVPLWSAAFLASLGLAPPLGCDTSEDHRTFCLNPTPIFVNGQDTGVDRCAAGQFRRREAKLCPPARRTDEPCNGYQEECSTDADCPGDKQLCVLKAGGICGCADTCTQDSDCGPNAVCACSEHASICAPSTCKTDADCQAPYLCTSYIEEPFCGGLAFACQAEADECDGVNDCPEYEECTVQDGHRVCGASCFIGRPFLVEGEERLAEAVRRADWTGQGFEGVGAGLPSGLRAAVVEHWTRVGLMEHASVAAFARFAMQLMSLGAPPELLVLTQQALADETQHALMAFGLAGAVGGEPVGPGPLCIEGGLEDNDARAIVGMLLHEGCIGETVAALEAAESLAHAYDPGVRAVLEKITRDEQAHAALAWKSLRWILERHPDLRPWARQELAEALGQYEQEPAAEPSLQDRDTLAWGVVSPSLRAKLRQEAIAHLVRPAAAQVLGVGPPYAGVSQHAPKARG